MIEESIEQCDTILRNLLSPYHFRVLVARLEGGSYTSIAHEFGRNPKSVDNALQRAKKLIFGYLEEHDDLDAADSGMRRAFLALASDAAGRKSQLTALLADSPCDYLAVVKVAKDTESLDAVLPGLHKTYVTCTARLVQASTGEITWAGTAQGASSHWYAGAEQEALAVAVAPQSP